MTNYSTLVELLQYRAISQPEDTAYIFLQDGVTESGKFTYQELDRQAKAIAAQLRALVSEGSRALVVYPYHAGLEFIAAFFGCLYAGVIAVTDSPPRRLSNLDKLEMRLKSSEAKVILTTQAFLAQFKTEIVQYPEAAAQFSYLSWIATDTIDDSLASNWIEPQIASDSLAFLQYTSGSTGFSKGVMVTHGNILYNERAIEAGFQHGENTTIVSWLPLFHDMGLIGNVLQALYLGRTSILMSPLSLVQKPVNWLQAISRYQATTSGGPNFAYDILSAKVTPEQKEELDLSRWDIAFSGAEPVRAETMERFAAAFADCGFRYEAFYPCYGMAETTLFVSGGIKQETTKIKYLDASALEQNKIVEVDSSLIGARSIVGCGRTWLEDKVLIVNPESLRKCSSGEVGEIWVSGLGVGKGYWNQPEETAKTFQAYTADTNEGPFLRTGDLGFLEDKELYITGRYKEVMIIWGRYQYPQHIELTVQKSHPALRLNCGAAFSIDLEGEEKLVIAQELERNYVRNFNLEEIVEAIRLAVAQGHMAEVHSIVLLKTGSIPKTSSGKIQRRGCRTEFLHNTLETIAQWKQDATEQNNTLEMIGMSEAEEIF